MIWCWQMKRFYSILTISDPKSGESCIVVCQTLQDEKDIIRHADNAGHKILNVVAGEDARPIFLNDYEL